MGGLTQSLRPASLGGTLGTSITRQYNPQVSTSDDSIPPMNPTNGYKDILQDVATLYPALSPYAKKAVVYNAVRPQWEDEGDKLETYLPWDDWNPHPGKVTTTLYKPYSSRRELTSAIAGDLIHMAGAKNPSTGDPIDPEYFKLKQAVKAARSPEQRKIDYKTWKDAKKSGDNRSFNDWWQESRGEAYVRGMLFPDTNDEWASWYEENPKLKRAVEKVGKYLRGENPKKSEKKK